MANNEKIKYVSDEMFISLMRKEIVRGNMSGFEPGVFHKGYLLKKASERIGMITRPPTVGPRKTSRRKYVRKEDITFPVVELVCRVCGEKKPVAEFTKAPDHATGYRSDCKSCKNKRDRLHKLNKLRNNI